MRLRIKYPVTLAIFELMAYRQYKHDISDIVGILREQQNSGDPLTLERIDKAVKDLYDSWDNLPENARGMIESILANEDMDALYEVYANEEAAAKDALITFEDKYPDVLKENNLDEILNHLLEHREDKQ